jgi:two-component system, NarL family, response regulator NreC
VTISRTVGRLTIRILLAAPDGIRSSLRKVLEESPDWEVVGEADDGCEAVRLADDLRPDVVLIDIGTSSIGGIEATRRITLRSPQTHVLVMGTYPDDAYVSRVRQAGGRGYLLKDSADILLQPAITALTQGRSFFHNRDITSTR